MASSKSSSLSVRTRFLSGRVGWALALGACSDAGFKRFNATPTASVTSPFDGQSVESGAVIELRGVVSDPDDDGASLRTWWFVGDREVCGETAAAADGSTVCSASIDADTIRLEVRDPENAAASDGVSIALGSGAPDDTGDPGTPVDTGGPEDTGEPVDLPAVCAITTPAEGDTLDPYTDVQLAGSVVDPDTPEAVLTARWTSDLDGILVDGATLDASGITELNARLSTGHHRLTLEGLDGATAVCSTSVSVQQPARCPGLRVDDSGAAYASVAGHADFVSDDSALSVSAWVRWDGSTGRSFHPIASQGWGNDATARFFLGIVGTGVSTACSSPDELGQVHFELKAGGVADCLASDRPLPIGQWTHVAATFDNGAMRLYINGKLDAAGSSADSTLRSVAAADLLLGASPTDGGLGLNGLLGGAHLSTVPITADFSPVWPPVVDSGTLGLWRLDDHASPAADSGGRGHDALPTGTSWEADCPDADVDADGFPAWEDCDDADAGVHPWAGDTLGDGVDSDCDGLDCEALEDAGVYWAVCDEPGTWSRTRDACQDAGYDDLATFSSAADEAVPWSILQTLGNPTCVARGYGCPWIGLSLSGSTWVWADGTASSYTNWAGPEPNGDGDCAHMNRYGDSAWNDTPCEITDGEFGMVCERILAP